MTTLTIELPVDGLPSAAVRPAIGVECIFFVSVGTAEIMPAREEVLEELPEWQESNCRSEEEVGMRVTRLRTLKTIDGAKRCVGSEI